MTKLKPVNTYKLSKRFFDFIFEILDAKPHEIALFFYIVDLANRLGWKEFIDLPTRLTMAGTKIGAYPTYKRALENLAKWGFIEWIYRAKNNTYAANIIKLKCFDENEEADVKALSMAVTMHYQGNGEAEAVTINNNLLNIKPETKDYIFDFLEKVNIQKYQSLELGKQKLIINNLKIVLNRNFDLLLDQDFSKINFEIKFRAEICPNFKDLEEKVANDISIYFGISEMNNFRLFAKLNRFVQFLSQTSQLEFFIEHFNFYKKYKEISAEKIHGFEKFIGLPEEEYQSGVWQSENYRNKLKHFETNQSNSNRKTGNSNLISDLQEGKNNVIRRLINGEIDTDN